MRKITFLMMFAFVTIIANAQISRYVKVSATGAGNGTSWADAAGNADIQTMIGQVAADANKGTVYFAAGTYLINTAITINDGVNLYGGYSSDGSSRDLMLNQTILDAQNQSGVKLLNASDGGPIFTKVTTVDGFVLQHGAGSYGSAVSMTLGVVLRNCIIRNNNGGAYGAAVFAKRNTTIPNGINGTNGKITGALVNCIIINNTSGYNFNNANPPVANPSAGGVYADTDSHISIFNCVIANNKCLSPNGSGGIYLGANIHWSPIVNSIFYNNEADATATTNNFNNARAASGSYKVTRNNWFNNSIVPLGLDPASTGNKTNGDFLTPNFVGPTSFVGYKSDGINEIASSDWRLKSNSNCISLGINSITISYPYAQLAGGAVAYSTIPSDIQGSNRIINTSPEAGAYEFNPIVVATASADINKGTVSANVTVSKGSTATVIATPLSGYKFTKWNDGTSDVSTSASYAFVPVADVTLTATFETDLGTGTNSVTTNRFVTVNNKKLTVAETGRLLVYNATGKLVVDKYIVGETVSVENSGVYFVKLRTEKGVKMQKVLVN